MAKTPMPPSEVRPLGDKLISALEADMRPEDRHPREEGQLAAAKLFIGLCENIAHLVNKS